MNKRRSTVQRAKLEGSVAVSTGNKGPHGKVNRLPHGPERQGARNEA